MIVIKKDVLTTLALLGVMQERGVEDERSAYWFGELERVRARLSALLQEKGADYEVCKEEIGAAMRMISDFHNHIAAVVHHAFLRHMKDTNEQRETIVCRKEFYALNIDKNANRAIGRAESRAATFRLKKRRLRQVLYEIREMENSLPTSQLLKYREYYRGDLAQCHAASNDEEIASSLTLAVSYWNALREGVRENEEADDYAKRRAVEWERGCAQRRCAAKVRATRAQQERQRPQIFDQELECIMKAHRNALI
eukprot:g2120.t1